LKEIDTLFKPESMSQLEVAAKVEEPVESVIQSAPAVIEQEVIDPPKPVPVPVVVPPKPKTHQRYKHRGGPGPAIKKT
jgi:hypothetical protein